MRRISVLLAIVFLLAMSALLVVGCGEEKKEAEEAREYAPMEVVQVDGGSIQGMPGTDGVTVFKGIPYAAPPVGELRWKEPQPVEPWEGIRPCFDFGPDTA